MLLHYPICRHCSQICYFPAVCCPSLSLSDLLCLCSFIAVCYHILSLSKLLRLCSQLCLPLFLIPFFSPLYLPEVSFCHYPIWPVSMLCDAQLVWSVLFLDGPALSNLLSLFWILLLSNCLLSCSVTIEPGSSPFLLPFISPLYLPKVSFVTIQHDLSLCSVTSVRANLISFSSRVSTGLFLW